MPFDIGESINYLADAFLRAPIVSTVVASPIYTALTLTFLIVLIVMFIFRDADTTESMLIISLRAGFWIFLAMTGALFLHNKVLTAEDRVVKNNELYDGIYRPVGGAALEDTIVPVVPRDE